MAEPVSQAPPGKARRSRLGCWLGAIAVLAAVGLIAGVVVLSAVVSFVNRAAGRGFVDSEVEVRPGEFLPVQARWTDSRGSRPERTDLIIEWNGQQVRWSEESVLTLCLRAFENRLYLIALERSNPEKARLRYYRQKGGTFERIKPGEFPKEIATENVFHGSRYERVGYDPVKVVDTVKLAVDLDPEAFLFDDSMTAKIWYNLVTGKPYYEMPASIDKKFLREYLAKYKPIRLTKIVRKAEQKPDTKPEAETAPAAGLEPAPAGQ